MKFLRVLIKRNARLILLLTKKGRSILTSFAGSIGIIGIALILALSSGFQNYVDKIQEDTLTSYPLTVQSETTDMASLLLSSNGKSEENLDLPDRTVEEKQNMEEMFGTVGKNDLKSFKTYIEENKDEVNKMVSLTSYQYSVAPTVYTKNLKNELVKVNPSDIMSSIMGGASVMMESSMSIFSELPESRDMTEAEYAKKSLKEHEGIVESMKKCDTMEAAMKMHQHIERSLEDVLTEFEK